MRGVKLDRQRHELEHGRKRKRDDADLDEHTEIQHETHQNERHGGGRADLRQRNDGVAQTDGRIADRILHRMARLMRGHADGRDRGGLIDRRGQADRVRPRIKMVGQLSGDIFDVDARHAVCTQHGLSRLRAGQPSAAHDARVAVERAVDLRLRPEREQHARQHQHDIVHINSVITHIRHGKTSLDCWDYSPSLLPFSTAWPRRKSVAFMRLPPTS